jgi:integrase
VRASQVQAALPATVMAKLATAVLAEHEVLEDDTVSSISAWIDRKCGEFPDGFRVEIRAWLLELQAGGERTRPRSRSTLYAYFGRVRPHLIVWARTYDHLREVTEQDVVDVLDSQRGHQRAGTFTSLRSLFGFAWRHRLVFTDPTRRLHVGQAPKRSVLPMIDDEIAVVKRSAVTLAQRLVVALVAVYAARAAAIRHLTLDDVDLARRRLRIGGTAQPMPELVHRLVREWLAERQRLWPHTPNRHVLLSRSAAAGTEPVSDYYLSWHLAMQDLPLERLRADASCTRRSPSTPTHCTSRGRSP